MSNNILVTGASSGIGKAVASMFLEKGDVVYGVGRDFSKCEIKNSNFHQVIINLSDISSIEKQIKELKNISIIVNCAGFGIFEQYEDIGIKSLQNLVNVNLLAPMIIVKSLLKQIKQNKGYIFNITSIEAINRSKFSAGYSATKAGLKAFGESLFQEVRKDEVSVVSINPEMTKTPFFDKLHFQPYDDKKNYISTAEICNTISFVLEQKDCVIENITIRAKTIRVIKKSKKTL